MRIRVDEIPDSGRFLRFQWGQEQLSPFMTPEDPFEIVLPKPLDVRIELQKQPDHVKVSGSVTGSVQVTCHRCLAPFLFPLEENIDLVMVREESLPQQDETELEEEELEFDFFDGEVIEMEHLVAEQVFLALPVKILCAQSCRGICPGCGRNLNDDPCTCSKETRSSFLTQLEEVKSKLPPQNRE